MSVRIVHLSHTFVVAESEGVKPAKVDTCKVTTTKKPITSESVDGLPTTHSTTDDFYTVGMAPPLVSFADLIPKVPKEGLSPSPPESGDAMRRNFGCDNLIGLGKSEHNKAQGPVAANRKTKQSKLPNSVSRPLI